MPPQRSVISDAQLLDALLEAKLVSAIAAEALGMKHNSFSKRFERIRKRTGANDNLDLMVRYALTKDRHAPGEWWKLVRPLIERLDGVEITNVSAMDHLRILVVGWRGRDNVDRLCREVGIVRRTLQRHLSYIEGILGLPYGNHTWLAFLYQVYLVLKSGSFTPL